MVKKLLRIFRWMGIILLGLLAVFSILPWLIPVPDVQDPEMPADMKVARVGNQTIRFRMVHSPDSLAEERPVFLLLHGFCGSAWSWRRFQDSLTDRGYHSVAMDIPPFGYSRVSNPSGYTDSARVSAVQEVMRVTFPGARWIIAGHSMGATLAGQVTVSGTGIIGVIGVDGAPFSPGRRSGMVKILRYPPLVRWAEVIGYRKLLTYEGVSGLLRSAYGTEPDSSQVRGYLNPMHRPGFPKELFEWASEPGIPVSAWQAGRAPILLVWGSDDEWIPVQAAHRFRDLYPGTTLSLVQGAGHCPMETHPESMVPIVVHWADSVSSLP